MSMKNKEIIQELIRKEMYRLSKYNYAPDWCGADAYMPYVERLDYLKGKDKYDKIVKINKYFETDKLRSRKISKDIPDWKNIIKELIIKELEELKKKLNKWEKSNSCTYGPRYHKAREEYQKLVMMKEKLENDKKRSKISILPKRETSFLDER